MPGTQAVDRAATLLVQVLAAGTPVTFGDLVRSSGLPKSTTSRLLTALELHQLVRRDRAGAWAPGTAVERYARSAASVPTLVRRLRPGLEAVVRDTGETANLAVVTGGAIDLVDQVDGTFILGTVNWVGREVPAHASALGKAFMAVGLLDPPRGRPLPLTPHTVTDVAVLGRQVARVRRDGYAVSRDELEIGLTAVAVPVIEAGRPVAAVSLSGPTVRLDQARVRALAAALREHFPPAGDPALDRRGDVA